jgi:hypothetical protein
LYSVEEEAILETFTNYDVKDFRGMLAVLDERVPGAFGKIKIDAGVGEAKKEGGFWKSKVFWSVAAGVLGLGLAAAGYWQNGEYDKLRSEYRGLPDSSAPAEFDKVWDKAESAKSARNGFYVSGGVLIGAGGALWIF